MAASNQCLQEFVCGHFLQARLSHTEPNISAVRASTLHAKQSGERRPRTPATSGLRP